MPSNKIIPGLFYFAIGLLLISLPFSHFTMSVAQFMLVGVFILDGIKRQEWHDFLDHNRTAARIVLFLPYALVWTARSLERKFRAFFQPGNAPALILASVYLMHLLGLIYTSDFHYAFKDLRIKFPLFLLPLILSTTGAIDRKVFRYLLFLFIAAVFTGTLISTSVYLTRPVTDTRDISIYISHIRFSLLIDIAVFQVLYLLRTKSREPAAIRLALAIAGLWMVAFLMIFAFMTGLVILLIAMALILIYLVLKKQDRTYRLITLSGLATVFLLTGFFVADISKEVNRVEPVAFSTLEKVTKNGHYYWHDTTNRQVENGHYVWLYISTEEMREAWNRRSRFDFDGKDGAGQDLRQTLIRFLTSKGFRKDAEGVNRLSDAEVDLVENGTASVVYVEKSMLYVRIYKIFWAYHQYQVTGNASGHSLLQRFEYWRTAAAIVRDNNSWLFGIGTGDLNGEFQRQYEKMGSKLDKAYRWRTHNQFLAIFVTFGLTGLLWFLMSLVLPAVRLKKFSDYFYLTFFIVFALSMLTEDTLETQAGVTQFAFFSSLYLFSKKFTDHI